MKIVKNYNDTNLIDNQEVLDQRFQRTVYAMSSGLLEHVQSLLLPGNTVVMFSGSWRFNLDATYLEAKVFQKTKLPIHQRTWFVEPDNSELFNKVLEQLAPKNLLLLHSGFFCNYESLDQIMIKISLYQQLINTGSQIILTIPQNRVDFNRLKYSCEHVSQNLSIDFFNDSFIVQRIKA